MISFTTAAPRPGRRPCRPRSGSGCSGQPRPHTGGRLGRVLVRGRCSRPRGRRPVLGVGCDPGRAHRPAVAGRTPTWSIKPSRAAPRCRPVGARVFGPTRAGTGVVVRLRPPCPGPGCRCPDRQELRWGRLDVDPFRDDGRTRPRAVPWSLSPATCGGRPRRWGRSPTRPCGPRRSPPPARPGRRQDPRPALGARELGRLRLRGVRHVRDEAFAGDAKERGYYGSRWSRPLAARLAGRPLRLPGRAGVLPVLVRRVHLQQRRVGERPAALVPEPLRHPTTAAAATTGTRTSLDQDGLGRRPGARLGIGTATAVRETKIPSWGGRVSRITVTGVKDGRRTSATVTGTWFRKAYGLKSTKFHISP